MEKITVTTKAGNKATVLYTLEGIPKDSMGLIPMYKAYTVKDVIRIQPVCKDDYPLLVHELTHVDQYFKYTFFSMRYKRCKSFRQNMEIEAFAAQLLAEGSEKNLNQYANEIATKYGLNVTTNECVTLLTEECKKENENEKFC